MKKSYAEVTTLQTQEIADRLNNALALLRQGGNSIPVERARAIADCAYEIVESVKVEARLSATTQEKK